MVAEKSKCRNSNSKYSKMLKEKCFNPVMGEDS